MAFGVSPAPPLHHGWAQAPRPTQMIPVVGPQFVEVLCGVLSMAGMEAMGTWALCWDSPECLPIHPLPGHPELAIPMEN